MANSHGACPDGIPKFFSTMAKKMTTGLNRLECLTAISEGEIDFNMLPEEFRNDRAFIMRLLEIDGAFLADIPLNFQQDKELAILSLHAGADFNLLDQSFRGDFEVMLVAIKCAGFFPERSPFAQVSLELRGDKKLAIEAIKRDAKAFQFIDKSLLSNQSFLIQSLQYNAPVFEFFPSAIQDDPEFVLNVISGGFGIDVGILEWASQKILDNKEVILEAIDRDHNSYRFASKRLKLHPAVLRLKHLNSSIKE